MRKQTLPLLDCLFFNAGTVSGEMFRQMQNSEIIRKMTEEFDEVPCFYYFLSNISNSRELLDGADDGGES